MARSVPWVVVTLLWLGSAQAAQSAPGPASPVAAAATAGTTAVSGLPEPPPVDAKADQIVEYATGLFKLQRYSEAGDALQLAYQREPRPIFLFNVGQTYRKAGRYADALTIYKRFIELAPEHPLIAEARAYEHTLAALVEQQERIVRHRLHRGTRAAQRGGPIGPGRGKRSVADRA